MGRRLAAALFGLALAFGATGFGRAEDDAPWGVIGAADAPVVLTEYVSPVSPSSARFWSEMLPPLKARYIDTGLVRLEVRERLVGPQPSPQRASCWPGAPASKTIWRCSPASIERNRRFSRTARLAARAGC